MTFCASGRGRGAMAQVFLTTFVLVLGLAVSWTGAEAEAEQAKPTGGSPPVFTLRTLFSGTCLEIQRYAEAAMGIGFIRSAVEVQSGATPSV